MIRFFQCLMASGVFMINAATAEDTNMQKHEQPVLKITRHGTFAREPLSPLPEGQKGAYGLGRIWQLSSTQVGVVGNVRSWGSDVSDVELGNDVLVFDNFDTHEIMSVTNLNQTGLYTDPETGKRLFLSKYPMAGGFVPLGALRADGSPHPHAGTGFGVCHIIGYPVDGSGKVNIRTIYNVKGKDTYRRVELQQYRFDGKRLHVEDSRIITQGELYDGWWLTSLPLGNCIPDGDDLLCAMIGFSNDAASRKRAVLEGGYENGIPFLVRWRRVDGQWRIAAIQTVSEQQGLVEPSLVRDVNSSLLYTARDQLFRPKVPLLLLWRSMDNGNSWNPILSAPALRAQAPVSVGMSLDGTAYFACCPPKGSDNQMNQRDRMLLWPLSPDRKRVREPIVVRDCPGEFGEPTHKMWRVDHPVGLNVRLSDGQWHHLLCYRIMEEHGASPTETTGIYVEEVLTERTVEPLWSFHE